MLEAFTKVHWMAVIAALGALSVLGGAWYMAIVPKVYARALGREGEPQGKPALLFIVGPVVCNAVVVVTTATLLRALSVMTLGAGVAVGAVVGLGYLVAMTMNIAINPNIPRPFLYTLVSGPYFFIGSLVTSVILVGWP